MSAPQSAKATVIIRQCDDYDVDRIERIIGEGLDTLGLRPFGRTLVKPNCVAAGSHFPNAFTRPEFLEGVFKALKSRAGSDVTEMALGERSGITMPTCFTFKNAKYYEMLDRVGGVEAYHFDEVPQVEIPLYHEGRLRDRFYTPEPVAKADFFVNCPKFKAHPWTTVTFSMKNYIGIQDDRHRLIDHDHRLDQKVADLQYITQPQFIAIDAIVAGEGRMLTPIPFDMRLVIMGNNQVAFDAVCCHIIGVDPMSVAHIRMAHERGFGPVDLDKIRVIGDVPLAAAQERCAAFKTGLIRVEDYFEGTNIRAYSGVPPGGEVDYCWGGCPGAMEEAIELLRLYDEAVDEKMPPIHIAFGKITKQIDAQPGEKVIFIGDCAEYHGSVAGQPVDIENVYRDRSKDDPTEAKHDDIYVKMASVEMLALKTRKSDVVRIRGCPVSVAEQVLLLVKMGKLKNPYLDPKEAVAFTSSYMSWRTRKLMKELFFRQPYNVKGPTERGAARPIQNSPGYVPPSA